MMTQASVVVITFRAGFTLERLLIGVSNKVCVKCVGTFINLFTNSTCPLFGVKCIQVPSISDLREKVFLAIKAFLLVRFAVLF